MQTLQSPTLTNSLTSPVVTGKLVSFWLTPAQTVYWKWRGGGIFREVMWWPDKPQPAKGFNRVKNRSQQQLALSVQMTLNAYENDPCLVSDHLYHELFHKSLYEKEQILHRGENQQALTQCMQLQTLHRKMCSAEQNRNAMLKHFGCSSNHYQMLSHNLQTQTMKQILYHYQQKSKEPLIYTLFFERGNVFPCLINLMQVTWNSWQNNDLTR